jgi:hypothetical protein
LVLGTAVDHASTGFLRLTLARTGGFSGQLILGTSRLNVRGTLNSAGNATVVLPRPGQQSLTLNLHLDLASPAQFLSANLNDGTTAWTIQADRKAPIITEPTALPRRYTFRIDPDPVALETPRGLGFGVATVTSANVATISGKLADGRPLAARGVLAANGNLSLYSPQFGRAGAFAASLQLSNEGLLSGSGRWLKPARPLDARYPAAFNATNAVLGGLYLPPAPGTRILAWEPDGNGVLTLSSGNLSASLAQEVALATSNIFTWAVPAIPSLRMSTNPATGNVAGSFLDSNGGMRTFRGVMIQQMRGAWGHFLGATESGAVALESAGE